MLNIDKLYKLDEPKALAIGNHPGIIQSVLDFDFLAGKELPSVIGIVGVRQKFLRFFWGNKEILLPGYLSIDDLDLDVKKEINLFIVAQSGRRVASVSQEALKKLPKAYGGMIFAEGVPERHANQIRTISKEENKFILGPASVGIVVGGICKLGAIGGTLPEQIVQAGILQKGSVAIISTSGGMINELINFIASKGSSISFAAAVGGERFPITRPVELVAQALADKKTKTIVYFGELGGTDEYEIAELLNNTESKKPLIAYIAGTFAESFESPPQFGHAKSLAQNQSETASAKKKILTEAGANVADSFSQFENKLAKLPKTSKSADIKKDSLARLEEIKTRKKALFVSRISSDKGGQVKILDTPLLDFVTTRSLSRIALSMFLGREPSSQKTVDFFDTCVRLLVDHGPQVAGAVNTMITARAGKDLTAALASGILTIGPRFGGAINQAAHGWFDAITHLESADSFVERHAQAKQYIPGIGHIKYRLDNPDPRVKLLMESFDSGTYTNFAKQVADITSRKKAQLILNVDGAIAGLLLDLLVTEENYSPADIKSLIDTDFCNAIFVYSRTVGLIAHHLEQQRLDENLFRLPNDQISSFD